MLHLNAGLIHFSQARRLKRTDLGLIPGDFHVHTRKMASDREMDPRIARVCAGAGVCRGGKPAGH